MPTLSVLDEIPTKKLILPSSTPDDEAWVVVYEKLLTGKIMLESEQTNDSRVASVQSVVSAIKDWYFTEKDGSKAPIDFDHVALLDFRDYSYILNNVKSFDVELPTALKKNLSSTSTLKQNETPQSNEEKTPTA